MKKAYKDDGKKPAYRGIRPFVKYGRFADAPAVQVQGAQAEEAHVQDAPVQGAQDQPAAHEQPAQVHEAQVEADQGVHIAEVAQEQAQVPIAPADPIIPQPKAAGVVQ